jgi:hypothetical protein
MYNMTGENIILNLSKIDGRKGLEIVRELLIDNL